MADSSLTDSRLSGARLVALPATIRRPAYDRRAIRPGIVHLGLGAFHRAHQAAITEDCLDAGERDWGIIGASLRSPATRDALAPQDNLYALALRDGDGEKIRVIGAVRGALVAPEDPAALVAALADPGIRIVTLTVTEAGYAANVATGALDEDDPAIRHDIATPAAPRTAPGYLCAALRRRRDDGIAPFTLLSCDNLPGNGRILHAALTRMAALQDEEFGRFVAGEVHCPSSMVDRIVPATTAADRDAVAARLGCRDEAAVVAEPFAQWVIEDRFPTGRPEWERGGAEFVADVAAHERTKLRLLNGAHTLLAAAGLQLGHETVADAVADPLLAGFLDRFWDEAAVTLPAMIDTIAYRARLRERFRNPALRHRLAQIATGSALKLPQRILLPCLERFASGRESPCMTLAIAAWMQAEAMPGEAPRALAARRLGRHDVFSDRAWRASPLRARIEEACIAIAQEGLRTVLGRAGC